MKWRNPECNNEPPTNSNYCNESCLRRHQEIKKQAKEDQFRKGFPLSAKILEQEQQSKNGFTDDLRDGAFQRGIMWRRNKLLAIFKARQAGISEEHVLRELRIGGITIQKAKGTHEGLRGAVGQVKKK